MDEVWFAAPVASCAGDGACGYGWCPGLAFLLVCGSVATVAARFAASGYWLSAVGAESGCWHRSPLRCVNAQRLAGWASRTGLKRGLPWVGVLRAERMMSGPVPEQAASSSAWYSRWVSPVGCAAVTLNRWGARRVREYTNHTSRGHVLQALLSTCLRRCLTHRMGHQSLTMCGQTRPDQMTMRSRSEPSGHSRVYRCSSIQPQIGSTANGVCSQYHFPIVSRRHLRKPMRSLDMIVTRSGGSAGS